MAVITIVAYSEMEDEKRIKFGTFTTSHSFGDYVSYKAY